MIQFLLPTQTQYRFLVYGWIIVVMTVSSSTCPLRFHSLVHSKNNFYFVVIKPQIKKDIFGACGVYKTILPVIEKRFETLR